VRNNILNLPNCKALFPVFKHCIAYIHARIENNDNQYFIINDGSQICIFFVWQQAMSSTDAEKLSSETHSTKHIRTGQNYKGKPYTLNPEE
jgi:hypothetical protein